MLAETLTLEPLARGHSLHVKIVAAWDEEDDMDTTGSDSDSEDESPAHYITCENCCHACLSSQWHLVFRCTHGYLHAHTLDRRQSSQQLELSGVSQRYGCLRTLCRRCRADCEGALDRHNRRLRHDQGFWARKALRRLPNELIAYTLQFVPREGGDGRCTRCPEPHTRLRLLR